MASHSGADFLCCDDGRPGHETGTCFYVHSHFTVCPAIFSAAVAKDVNPMSDMFMSSLPGVFYNNFFCEFAVSQKKDEYYAKGCRRVVFFIHCHCTSPWNLQCRAATAALKNAIRAQMNIICTDHYLTAPKICCDSWMCTPLKFMGYYASITDHFYFFLISDSVDEKSLIWPDNTKQKIFKVHESLKIVVIRCSCVLVRECKRRIEEHFNMMRVFISCIYDLQDNGDVNNLGERPLRLVFEGMRQRLGS